MSPRFLRLDDWLAWLEQLHPTEIELGLERVRDVAEALDLLAIKASVVTVAGTNGKGSFVCALSAFLKSSGVSFGAYTSPHIQRYNERISINGTEASDDDICEALDAIDRARQSTSLTYFEFGTLAALYLFKKYELDYYVLEVGLGGRLDAVNIVDADISVLTSVGLDHEAWLGNTREAIGFEKAGIFRADKPSVCVATDIPQSVLSRIEELACQPYILGEEISINEGERRIIVSDAGGHSHSVHLDNYQLPLPSIAAALQAHTLLFGANELSKLAECIGKASLAARFELVQKGDDYFLLDVAHNRQAAELLARNLRSSGYGDLTAIFTCTQDKDLRALVEPLSQFVSRWICVDIPSVERCRSGKRVAEELSELGYRSVYEPSVTRALNAGQAKGSSVRPVLVFGSFFLISEVKSVLSKA